MRWLSLLLAATVALSMQESVAEMSPLATQSAALIAADQAGSMQTDGELPAVTSAPTSSGCSFQPPSPILQSEAYTGQAVMRKSQNRMTEKAQLRDGVHIEIRQSACVDFLITEFILVVRHGQHPSPDHGSWIEFARSGIVNLKLRNAAGYADLNDFLRRANAFRPRDGIRSACRDGSSASPGQCSWESQGGFVFSVTRTGQATRLSVIRYVSG